MNQSKPKKPVKLEIQVQLAEVRDETRVVLKNEKKQLPSKNEESFALPKILKGTVSCRRESKGRGGRTVCILHDFSEHALRSKDALKIMCSRLKNSLACGGTVEDSTLIIQLEDAAKVTQILNSWGLKVKRTGG